MGCCSSRPRQEGSHQARPPNFQAVVPPSIGSSHVLETPPRLRNGSRPASSSNSVATSNGRRTDIALNQHYNAPLRGHVWRVKASRRPWTRTKWIGKREEFFHTRVTNRPEIWSSLHTVVGLLDQHDLATAQGIIDASEITLPTGDLADGAYDSFGNLYQLPNYAISPPENMVEDEEEEEGERGQREGDGSGGRIEVAKGVVHTRVVVGDKASASAPESPPSPSRADKAVVLEKGKAVVRPEDSISVKARLSDRGGLDQDVVVVVGKNDSTKVVIEAIADKAQVSADKIKIAYMGKIFKANKGFVSQGWQTGHVINALVAP